MLSSTAITTQVSIHVPLAEHDLQQLFCDSLECSFNSRAPRGARPAEKGSAAESYKFQFTCPSRSTTSLSYGTDSTCRFQFTCPSRSTTQHVLICIETQRFQFTCPSRSTTRQRVLLSGAFIVSIHVPLAEHDVLSAMIFQILSGFNSRAPRGARRNQI